MTHTSHPYGYRLGITRDWRSQWFSRKPEMFRAMLREDHLIRDFFSKELADKMVSDLLIERERDALSIVIKTARPGLIIGREGADIASLIAKTKRFAKKNGLNEDVRIRVEEVRLAEQDAVLVADSIIEALKKRMHHRRLMKSTLEKVMANRNVRGCRILLSGRLGGAEIARKEEVHKGNVPLQTLRADIDYTHREAILPYGIIGVKVWIYKGNIGESNS